MGAALGQRQLLEINNSLVTEGVGVTGEQRAAPLGEGSRRGLEGEGLCLLSCYLGPRRDLSSWAALQVIVVHRRWEEPVTESGGDPKDGAPAKETS